MSSALKGIGYTLLVLLVLACITFAFIGVGVAVGTLWEHWTGLDGGTAFAVTELTLTILSFGAVIGWVMEL